MTVLGVPAPWISVSCSPRRLPWLQSNLSCPAGRQKECMDVLGCVPWWLQELGAVTLQTDSGGEGKCSWEVLWAGLNTFTQYQGVLLAPHPQGCCGNTKRLWVLQVTFPCAALQVLSQQVPDLWTQGTAPVSCKNMDFNTHSLYLCLCCLVNWAGMKWHRLKLCVTLKLVWWLNKKVKNGNSKWW